MRQNIAALLIATASAVNVDKANHNPAYDAPYNGNGGQGGRSNFGPISSGHFGGNRGTDHVVVTNTDTRPTGDYASSFLSDFDYLKGSHHTAVPDFSNSFTGLADLPGFDAFVPDFNFDSDAVSMGLDDAADVDVPDMPTADYDAYDFYRSSTVG